MILFVAVAGKLLLTGLEGVGESAVWAHVIDLIIVSAVATTSSCLNTPCGNLARIELSETQNVPSTPERMMRPVIVYISSQPSRVPITVTLLAPVDWRFVGRTELVNHSM